MPKHTTMPNYIGKLRVPITCNLRQLDCPSSWKSGIPEGGETSAPMIYQKFLNCHEGFTLCAYVPIDPKSGEVLGQSGVTIGAGVDLGNKSRAYFTSLSSTLLDKLDPYFGLKRNLAACAAIERPLSLTLAEANTLTNAATKDVVNEFQKDTTAIKIRTRWRLHQFFAEFVQPSSAFGISLAILRRIQGSGVS